MPQKDCKILGPGGVPIGDNPIRTHRSYMDCYGTNPMQAAFDNCFIKSRLGVDPVTGKPMDVFDEQINREKQILESLGEVVLIYRKLIIPDKTIENRRCPLCWDKNRSQARSSCPLCNGFGVVTNNNDELRVGGFQLLRNPERDDGFFFVNAGIAPKTLDSQDQGLMINQDMRFWTVPVRNCEGKITNIIDQRDIMIRFIFDADTEDAIKEIGRYEVTDSSYSLTRNNKLLHMEFSVKRLDPGIKQREYALPNTL
jgi:hypothetical protein